MLQGLGTETYLQAPFDKTPTSTSLRVEDSEPPEEVVPQPVTVAVTPAYDYKQCT